MNEVARATHLQWTADKTLSLLAQFLKSWDLHFYQTSVIDQFHVKIIHPLFIQLSLRLFIKYACIHAYMQSFSTTRRRCMCFATLN